MSRARYKSSDPTTYEQAYSKASYIWACGDGRCMPCGRLHDFCYTTYASMNRMKIVHRFRCWQNHEHGCPREKPKPKHKFVNGRCEICKAKEPWKAPNGEEFYTLDSAKRAGFKRSELTRG